jgi:hypothetical protein
MRFSWVLSNFLLSFIFLLFSVNLAYSLDEVDVSNQICSKVCTGSTEGKLEIEVKYNSKESGAWKSYVAYCCADRKTSTSIDFCIEDKDSSCSSGLPNGAILSVKNLNDDINIIETNISTTSSTGQIRAVQDFYSRIDKKLVSYSKCDSLKAQGQSCENETKIDADDTADVLLSKEEMSETLLPESDEEAAVSVSVNEAVTKVDNQKNIVATIKDEIFQSVLGDTSSTQAERKAKFLKTFKASRKNPVLKKQALKAMKTATKRKKQEKLTQELDKLGSSDTKVLIGGIEISRDEIEKDIASIADTSSLSDDLEGEDSFRLLYETVGDLEEDALEDFAEEMKDTSINESDFATSLLTSAASAMNTVVNKFANLKGSKKKDYSALKAKITVNQSQLTQRKTIIQSSITNIQNEMNARKNKAKNSRQARVVGKYQDRAKRVYAQSAKILTADVVQKIGQNKHTIHYFKEGLFDPEILLALDFLEENKDLLQLGSKNIYVRPDKTLDICKNLTDSTSFNFYYDNYYKNMLDRNVSGFDSQFQVNKAMAQNKINEYCSYSSGPAGSVDSAKKAKAEQDILSELKNYHPEEVYIYYAMSFNGQSRDQVMADLEVKHCRLFRENGRLPYAKNIHNLFSIVLSGNQLNTTFKDAVKQMELHLCASQGPRITVVVADNKSSKEVKNMSEEANKNNNNSSSNNGLSEEQKLLSKFFDDVVLKDVCSGFLNNFSQQEYIALLSCMESKKEEILTKMLQEEGLKPFNYDREKALTKFNEANDDYQKNVVNNMSSNNQQNGQGSKSGGCCQDAHVDCFACKHNMTKDQVCAQDASIPGCQQQGSKSGGCCQDAHVDCFACKYNMTKDQVCAQDASIPGCSSSNSGQSGNKQMSAQEKQNLIGLALVKKCPLDSSLQNTTQVYQIISFYLSAGGSKKQDLVDCLQGLKSSALSNSGFDSSIKNQLPGISDSEIFGQLTSLINYCGQSSGS